MEVVNYFQKRRKYSYFQKRRTYKQFWYRGICTVSFLGPDLLVFVTN